MNRLNLRTLRDNGYDGYLLESAPERVLQFGTGNFLRAFAGEFIDVMNEKAGFDGKVVVSRLVKSSREDAFSCQDGLYTLILRGRENGEPVERRRVISCVSRCIDPYGDFNALLECARNPEIRWIISNSTEAGIVFDPECDFADAPPASFPAKLTRFLFERYQADLPGVVILACELIDDNGEKLRACVMRYAEMWRLGGNFMCWLESENLFCSTLVDRIVTGYPKDGTLAEELGYEDALLTTGEVFASWVIEGPKWLKEKLPFEQAGLPISVVDDVRPYKQRKVRILNGAHTSMVTAAYLAGQDIVRGCMEDETIRAYMNRALYDEIIPVMTLPEEELTAFADAVADRFNNPYIDHKLLAIALNSTAKWRARVLPSVKDYIVQKDCVPKVLTFSLAAQIAFYANAKVRGEDCLVGCRNGEKYEIRDDAWVLDFYMDHVGDSDEVLLKSVLSNGRMWGEDLTQLPGFADAVAADYASIAQNGMKRAMQMLLEESV